MYLKKKSILMMLVIVFALLLASCSQGTTTSTTVATTAATTVATTAAPVDTSFVITDIFGNSTDFEEPVGTVVSLSPTLTEIIFALDAKSQLIGRTDYCNFPAETSEIASIGDLYSPSLEAIVALNPDVVVSSSILDQETAAKIEEMGIKVLVICNETAVAGTYYNIESLGMLLGKSDNATTLVSSIKSDIEAIVETVKSATKVKTYYVLGCGEYGDYTAGAGTFISEMISLAGGINVADDTEGWTYSLEQLAAHNPEVLLCSMYSPSEVVITTPGYTALSATTNERVYTLNDDITQRTGPRIAEGLLEMAKAIHPDLF